MYGIKNICQLKILQESEKEESEISKLTNLILQTLVKSVFLILACILKTEGNFTVFIIEYFIPVSI